MVFEEHAGRKEHINHLQSVLDCENQPVLDRTRHSRSSLRAPENKCGHSKQNNIKTNFNLINVKFAF